MKIRITLIEISKCVPLEFKQLCNRITACATKTNSKSKVIMTLSVPNFQKCDQPGAKQYMASPDFFRLLLTQFLKMAFITAMIIAFLISNPQFSIWNISYISPFYSSWMFIQKDINECTSECRQAKQTTLRSHMYQFIPAWADAKIPHSLYYSTVC